MTELARVETTFAALVSGREGEFPLLARAVRDQGPPPRFLTLEWRVGGEEWVNFPQVVRFAKRSVVRDSGTAAVSPADDREAWDYLLSTVEEVLEHGAPSCQRVSLRLPRMTCGGFRHYLGRGLRDDDLLSLRVVREPFRQEWVDPGGSVGFDWIAEFSLEVRPGSLVMA